MASPLPFLLPLLCIAARPDGWLGIYLDQGREEPAVVEVIPDSPAAKAGLQVGDVIVRMGDAGPIARERLRATLAAAKPGDRLELTVRRGDKEHRVVVRLGERPDTGGPKPEVAPRPSRPGQPPQPAAEPALPPSAPRGDTEQRVVVRLGERPDPVGPKSEVAPPPPASASAPVRGAAPAPAASEPSRAEFEAEIAALRAELAALRRQLEALRQSGRE